MVLDRTVVLLVEDEDDSRELLAEGLSRGGATVHAVPSAEAALTALRSLRPDVMLIDLTLPTFDGYTLLQMIRVNPHLASIPAIALTGHGRAADRARSVRVGFQKHLVKPTRLEDIISAISVLRGSAAADTVHPSIDVRSVLESLNVASGCRFTSLLRFATDDTLVSLWTYDREQPHVDPFPLALPIHASYCVLVRSTLETTAIENAASDERVVAHPKRFELACYIGAPLFYSDGRVFGTVCCYDETPRELAPAMREKVEATARRLEPDLWRLFEGTTVIEDEHTTTLAPAPAAT